MDLMIMNMREELVDTLNSYPIPMEVKRMVLREMLEAVTAEVQKAVEAQKEQAQKETEAEDDNSEHQS